MDSCLLALQGRLRVEAARFFTPANPVDFSFARTDFWPIIQKVTYNLVTD